MYGKALIGWEWKAACTHTACMQKGDILKYLKPFKPNEGMSSTHWGTVSSWWNKAHEDTALFFLICHPSVWNVYSMNEGQSLNHGAMFVGQPVIFVILESWS